MLIIQYLQRVKQTTFYNIIILIKILISKYVNNRLLHVTIKSLADTEDKREIETHLKILLRKPMFLYSIPLIHLQPAPLWSKILSGCSFLETLEQLCQSGSIHHLQICYPFHQCMLSVVNSVSVLIQVSCPH